MRQVPAYLLIGSGRVAQHMQRYLAFLSIPYQQWSRRANTTAELAIFSENCSLILLLIKDNAIAAFVEQYPFLQEKTLIHFSGQLTLPGIFAAHPLTSFIEQTYDVATYKKIPFCLAEQGPPLSVLLPGLPNPSYRIPDSLRSFYHALCVISGNFTVLLWQKFFKEMEERFQIPKEATFIYLQQVMANLMHCPAQALTGPLVRNDQATLEAHLTALRDDEYLSIYQAFISVYQTMKRSI